MKRIQQRNNRNEWGEQSFLGIGRKAHLLLSHGVSCGDGNSKKLSAAQPKMIIKEGKNLQPELTCLEMLQLLESTLYLLADRGV